MSIRLGIDVGGTFTDLLLFDEVNEVFHLHKTPSTPDDQSLAILQGVGDLLDQSGVSADQVQSLLHGTTVGTNIVLEGKGARVGLLVTENFEQVLHLARSQTPGPLAGWITMQKPDPLADLEFTRGIPERINARGQIIQPLDEACARQLIDELVNKGAESITISLLHGYTNPTHERKLRDIIAVTYPDLPVSISSEILPEFREYERTLVTVMNAYIRPDMRGYLAGFKQKLEALNSTPKLHIVRSDSGLMGIEHAMESPVYTLLSGPAGGVGGAAYLSRLAGHPDTVGFDMGGTSTDISLIRNGHPTASRQTSLGSYPIKIPSVEVHSVGAGGGSIAHVPMTGALRVGPESAGAFPGPACYGNGGTAATVTDANVVLGRLPEYLLGGKMPLDIKAAEDAVGAVARQLDLDVFEAAQGIIDIVNENMFGALRLTTVQKGLDPRNFGLVAFGGAGPLHANALAILGRCYPVIVPPTPGVLSALGFLQASVRNEATQSIIRNLSDVTPEELGNIASRLTDNIRNWLSGEGIAVNDQSLQHEIDMRYLRQGYELSLPFQAEKITQATLQDLGERFNTLHEQHYGFKVNSVVEIVNLRVIGLGKVAEMNSPKAQPGGADPAAALAGERQVFFDGARFATNIYERNGLTAGNEITGPAIISQTDSTTMIHPDHVATVDEHLNILIQPRIPATETRH
ncbi:MAG: hydantoinase/oxoprolinase family protein [Pseudomonadota bacterium]|nr:hydantoinase/oxoprolinase family protein [Pseudomonadota bacterium]